VGCSLGHHEVIARIGRLLAALWAFNILTDPRDIGLAGVNFERGSASAFLAIDIAKLVVHED
jgi:hypothetical protein